MATYSFGKLQIDPATNPSVLDTGTWDAEKIASLCKKLPTSFYEEIVQRSNGRQTDPNPVAQEISCHTASVALHGGAVYGMLEFADKQTAFVMIGSEVQDILDQAILTTNGPDNKKVV
ncbi:MAG: hypothetical protein CVV48_15880, partial [Spirochaetae bacterium HGW-Spirochaetae-4]